MIYHIAYRADWAAGRAAGRYTVSTVLVIDPEALSSPVRLEPPAPGAAELFPHIYGPIEVAAVVETVPLAADAEGRFRFSR